MIRIMMMTTMIILTMMTTMNQMMMMTIGPLAAVSISGGGRICRPMPTD